MKNLFITLFLLHGFLTPSSLWGMEDAVPWGGGGSRTKAQARRGSWVAVRTEEERQETMLEMIRRGSHRASVDESEVVTITPLSASDISQLQALIRDHNISKVSRVEVSPTWNRIVSALTCCCRKSQTSSRGCCSRSGNKLKAGLRGMVHPGVEYFALGIFPGWAWMAGKFRIWGSVVYPNLFDIHDESGKPLAFNYEGYSLSESFFIGGNYWFSVAYLTVLSTKIIHKSLVTPCCSPRSGHFCCSKKKYPLKKRTGRLGHWAADAANAVLTLAVVSPELVLYAETLKTKGDVVRHGVSLPLYAAAEGGEIFTQQRLSAYNAVNRLYDRGKGSVVEKRELLGHFLRSACNAIQFGMGDGKPLSKDFREMLYQSLFLFKGSARSKISGHIDHREWRGAEAVLLKLFFMGQQRDIMHELARIDPARKNKESAEREEAASVFPDTPEGRWQQAKHKFLEQALLVLRYRQNMHWTYQIINIHASFTGGPALYPQRNDEISKLSFLRSDSLPVPDDMTNNDTAAEYLAATGKQYHEGTTRLNQLKEELDTRKAAKDHLEKQPSLQEQRWRNLMSSHPEESTEKAMNRAKWTVPLGAALGAVGAKLLVKGLVSDLVTSFGGDSGTAESIGEPMGWAASLPGAFFGARILSAAMKPVDVLESKVRSTMRGIARLANVVALPAAYWGYKRSSAGALRGISNYFSGESASDMNTKELYDLYTLKGTHPSFEYESLNGTSVLARPDELTLYGRGSVSGAIVPAIPMALLTFRLGWRMFTDQVVHLHDSWNGYRYYDDTNEFNPHAYSRLSGEMGWVAFNAFSGSWWALTFLSGVFKPGLEAGGVSSPVAWASGVAALLARGSYESKIVERHWMDLGALAAKKYSLFRGNVEVIDLEGRSRKRKVTKDEIKDAVMTAKLLILVQEMVHFLEVEAPDALVNNISKWIKPS